MIGCLAVPRKSFLTAAAFLALAFDQSFNVVRKRTAFLSRSLFGHRLAERARAIWGWQRLGSLGRRSEARENEMLEFGDSSNVEHADRIRATSTQ